MKSFICRCLPLMLAVALLTGCGAGATNGLPASSSVPPALSQTEAPASDAEGAAALRMVPQWPERYGYTVESMTNVPEFLTDDQQALFKAAVRMYDGLYGCSAGYLPRPTDTVTVTMDGQAGVYVLDEGFARYADFENSLHAVFTDAFCEELMDTLKSDKYPRLKQYEGRLYALDGGRGSDMEYVMTRYTLTSESADVIEFDMIGRYNSGAPDFENPVETRDATKDYTRRFPIRMERTEKGWRFASFAIEK